MAWIESHQSLLNHPKTLAAAGELRCDRVKLIGHLHVLWWWALDIVDYDGNFPPRCTAAVIARGAIWKGKPEPFVNALVDSGFIDNTPNGRLQLHDWYEYAGKYNARKNENKQRQQAFRDKQRHPIYQRDGGRCRYCGKAVTTAEFVVDHIYPYRRGGAEGEDNLATACGSCNLKKGNRTPEEAGMELLLLTHVTVTSQENASPPTSPLSTNQPTGPTGPTVATAPVKNGVKAAALSPYNLSPGEWSEVMTKFPGVNVQSYWHEWVVWIEEREGARKPESNMAAFIGFLKKKTEPLKAAAAP